MSSDTDTKPDLFAGKKTRDRRASEQIVDLVDLACEDLARRFGITLDAANERAIRDWLARAMDLGISIQRQRAIDQQTGFADPEREERRERDTLPPPE